MDKYKQHEDIMQGSDEHRYLSKEMKTRARELAQQLRALAAVAEDLR